MSVIRTAPVAEPVLNGLFSTRVPIGTLESETRVAGKIALDRDRLLGLARNVAPDPKIFEEEGGQPYFWTAVASNNEVDFYYTTMGRTSLRNYAAEASTGRAFLLGHRSWEMPVGYSVEGTFTDVNGNRQARTEVAAYTIPGLEMFDASTSGIIRGLRSGLYRDVSIGFSGGEWICNICGNDMLRSWDCYHINGWEYEVKDSITGVVRTVQCVATVENAHLNEISLVYDGATPNAMVLKAESMAEAGMLGDAERRFVTTRCKRELPTKRLIVPAVDISQRSEEGAVGSQAASPQANFSDDMPDEVRGQNSDCGDPIAEIIPKARSAGDAEIEDEATPATRDSEGTMSAKAPEETPDATTTAFVETVRILTTEKQDIATKLKEATDELTTLRAADASAKAELQRLRDVIADHEKRALDQKAQDDEYQAYRADAIEQALEEGRRGMGEPFVAAEETYTQVLKSSTIAQIRTMARSWKAQGDAKFGGGRKTSDETTDPEQENRETRDTNTNANGAKKTTNPSFFRQQ